MNTFIRTTTIALAAALAAGLLLGACANPGPQSEAQVANVNFPDFSSAAAGDHFDAQTIAALEARVQQFVQDDDVKGIATLLVKDGKVVSHTKAGVRRLSDGAPITDDTIYRIYSMTKPITGVALMMLYEQGLFSLDDPVDKFIPEFKEMKVVKSSAEDGSFEVEDLQRQPTMRELLSHTAGFAYGLYGTDPSNRLFQERGVLASPDLDTFIERVAGIPLMYQPGELWFYSAAVDIQGAIVERLSGMPFGDFLQSRIFQPLGMVDTGFFVPEQDYHRFSEVFAHHPVTKEFQRVPFVEPEYNVIGDLSYREQARGMQSGGGGLVSTMADYARFCQMLANDGSFNGKQLLQAETLTLMRTNVLSGNQKVAIDGTLSEAEATQFGFGLGFGVYANPTNEAGKMGDGSYFWGGAAGTWFWVDPVHNLYFIGMIQRFPQGAPQVDFRGITRDLVYQALQQ